MWCFAYLGCLWRRLEYASDHAALSMYWTEPGMISERCMQVVYNVLCYGVGLLILRERHLIDCFVILWCEI